LKRTELPKLASSRATSAEVARHAGVSRATVSLVLNGRARDLGISADTRARVAIVAKRLGYQPNHAARSLRQSRTNVIAFLLQNMDSYYNNEVVGAAQAAAAERGYTLSVMSVRSEELQRHAFNLLSGGVADGVVVAAPPESMLSDLKALAVNGAPVVVLQHHSPDPDIQAVRVDLERGGYLATRHLIDLGHRAIGHIGNDAQHLQKRADRTDGYLRAMAEAGMPVDSTLIADGETSLAGGHAAMVALLRRNPRPTAVFVYNDQMAVGALHALREHGLRPPEDMALIGFDGIALGQFVAPELTTIDYPRGDIGRLAVETVMDRLNGADAGEHERVLPVRLLVRQSCGAPVPSRSTS
jgi:DNA-binding LacI/PurR family transcriptional regulator